MKKIIFVVCFIIAANLYAYGQPRRGQRGVRPGQNPPTPTSTPTPAPAPNEATGQTASGQQAYKSAIEYQSFMQLRFYENQGGFLVEDLEVVFPPSGQQKATFVISRANGQVVSSVPLRLETPLASYTAFGMF